MSDNQPVFNIQRVYLKGASLEIPHAPQIFLEQQQPSVEVQLDVSPQALAENIYETTVTATVTTKIEDKVAFLVEASEAGIFEIRGLPSEQMELVLHVVCANVVYPYLRGNVADLIQRGGFPPVHLAEINFEALYQQRLQAQGKTAAGPDGSGAGGSASGGAAGGGQGSGIILPS